jgi:perosamine synthetase
MAQDQFLSWPMMSLRTAQWVLPSSVATARYTFFQARYAIYHSLKLLGIQRGARVLVPSFICRAAIDPLLAYGADIDFYPVTADCRIDVDDLEARITPATQAVLIVHYFGFPQRLSDVRKLCDAHRLALIEDCAHVLSGEVEGCQIGSVGDAAVFSWRKFFPIYDGGELVLNRPARTGCIDWAKESPLFTLKVAANMMEASLARAEHPLLKHAFGAIRAGQGLVWRRARRYLNEPAMMNAEKTSVTFDAASLNWPMSRISRWAKNHSNVPKIISRRRRNYEMLLKELSPIKQVRPLFSEMPAGICPWVLPAFFEDLMDVDVLLRRRGVPAAKWGGVRHPRIAPGIFVDSDLLYDRLIFLPVHQCLEDSDVLNIAQAARELYQ